MKGDEREVISLYAIPVIQRGDRVSDLVGDGLDPPVSPCGMLTFLEDSGPYCLLSQHIYYWTFSAYSILKHQPQLKTEEYIEGFRY